MALQIAEDSLAVGESRVEGSQLLTSLGIQLFRLPHQQIECGEALPSQDAEDGLASLLSTQVGAEVGQCRFAELRFLGNPS